MNGNNVPNDGGDNVPPDPPSLAHGGPTHPTPPSMYEAESPNTKFKFQAKIDINRDRNDTEPLRVKAVLIELLLQHQKVDPSFHFLPTEDGSTASAITKATEIPNSEDKIKQYVKEMRDIDNGNKSKYYTVVFYIKVASSMTLGMMKKDNDLFMWLRNSNIWIRAFHFTTTYDVITAGFISHMSGGIHNRDRINTLIQTAMKTSYPDIEVKLVPTTIKHGLDARNKRITHVVSFQADRRHLNEAREALVEVFKTSAEHLPKDIFFVPSPANGMIKPELYYNLLNAHHEHMANIRSFAITGVANLNTHMTAQDNTDAASSIDTTFEKIIMDAKVPGTDQLIFSSIEPTLHSDTEGRYLLLTDSTKLTHAEHMIDELIKYIADNPHIDAEVSITGEDLRRANRVKVSNAFHGYTDFLTSKVPNVITTNPAQNAWHKRREPTPLDYTNTNFPPMDATKKARLTMTDDTCITENLSEPTDTVLVDLETELAKEREITDKRMTDIQQTLTAELETMKREFRAHLQKSIEDSEARMTSMIKQNIEELLRSSDATIARVELKSSEAIAKIVSLMQDRHHQHTHQPEHSSPARKQSRGLTDDVEMHSDADTNMYVPITPANHSSHPQRGQDTVASERK